MERAFESHARSVGSNSDGKAVKQLNFEQFSAALDDINLFSNIYDETSVRRLLFRIADRRQCGMITLEDWQTLHSKLQSVYAEYELAFSAFDAKGRGKLSKQEFLQAATTATGQSEAVRLFFGENNGTREISMNEFSELARVINQERLMAEFRRNDPSNSGAVGGEV